MDRLYVMAVGIEQVCGVVVGGVGANARRPVVATPGLQARPVELVHSSGRLGDERYVESLAWPPRHQREGAELDVLARRGLLDSQWSERSAVLAALDIPALALEDLAARLEDMALQRKEDR
jgi:hypothetical protein